MNMSEIKKTDIAISPNLKSRIKAQLRKRYKAFRPVAGVSVAAFCVGSTIVEYATQLHAGSASPHAIIAAIKALGTQLGIDLISEIFFRKEPPSQLSEEQLVKAIQETLEQNANISGVRKLLKEFDAFQLAFQTWSDVQDERWQILIDELSQHPEIVVDQVTDNLRKLLDPHLVSFDKRLKHIQKILVGSSFFSSPFVLPPDLPTFTGRSELLLKMDELLHPGNKNTVTLVGLKGMAGVGKSALAIHAAYKWKDRFPDGVLWIDLRESSDACEALRSVARSFGYLEQTAKMGDDLRVLADFVRNILSGKKLLLIFDNAEGLPHQDIKNLVPNVTGPVSLFTSRRDFSVLNRFGATLRVDVMQEDEAITLLARIVNPKDIEKEKIEFRILAKRLGYLPLALDIAGRRMHEQGWKSIDILQRLNSTTNSAEFLSFPIATEPEESVGLAFALSYDMLDDLDKKLFISLSPFASSGFRPNEVAYILGSENDVSVENILDRLVSLSLVRRLKRSLKFDLHPLLRDYAEALAKKQGTDEEIKLRMVEYFSEYSKNHGASWRTYDNLELQIENILIAVKWGFLLARKRDDSSLWYSIHLIGKYTRDFLRARGYWDEKQALLQASIEANRNLSDWENFGINASYLGWLHCRRGNLDEAENWANECIEAMRRTTKDYNVAVGIHLLGVIFMRRNNYGKAQEYLQGALKAVRKHKDLDLVGERFYDDFGAVLGDFGVLAYEMGDYKLAESRFFEAFEYAEQKGDLEGTAVVLAHLAGTVHRNGNSLKARKLYEQGIHRATAIGRLSTLARCKRGLSEIIENEGNRIEAISLAEESMDIYSRLGRASDVEILQRRIIELTKQI